MIVIVRVTKLLWASIFCRGLGAAKPRKASSRLHHVYQTPRIKGVPGLLGSTRLTQPLFVASSCHLYQLVQNAQGGTVSPRRTIFGTVYIVEDKQRKSCAKMCEWTSETAEWYAENYGEYATNRLTVEALDFAPTDVVVDIGCGTGAAIRSAAATRVTSGRLIGIDPVPRMVEIAKERLAGHAAADRIEIREGYAHALPVDSGIADWVLGLDSYDHWGDKSRQAEGLREVVRVLKASSGKFAAVKDKNISQEPGDRESFRAALNDAGLSVKREEELAGDDVSFTLWVCELA